MGLKKHIHNFKNTFSLAYAATIAAFGHILMGVTDNYVVGNYLGTEPLAGVALANSFYFIISFLAFGSSTAVTSLVAEAHGQKDYPKISQVFKNGFWFCLILALILNVLMLNLLWLVDLLDQPEAVKNYCKDYLGLRLFTLFPIMVFIALERLCEGMSYTKPLMITVLTANIWNFFLDVALVKGFWIFPSLGVYGVAFSTVFTSIMMAVHLFWLMRKNPETRKILNMFRKEKISLFWFKKLSALGFPSGLHLFSEAGAFHVATFICSWVSTADVAAYQISFQIILFPFTIAYGVALATQIQVSNLFGQKDYGTMIKLVRHNMYSVFVLETGIIALIAIFNRQVSALFLDATLDGALTEQTLAIASVTVLWAVFFEYFDTIQFLMSCALRGIQDTKIPSVLAVICYWFIGVPLAYLLGYVFKFGALGAWWGLGIGLIIAAFLLWWRFEQKVKKLALLK